jgi:hypothetical protein
MMLGIVLVPVVPAVARERTPLDQFEGVATELRDMEARTWSVPEVHAGIRACSPQEHLQQLTERVDTMWGEPGGECDLIQPTLENGGEPALLPREVLEVFVLDENADLSTVDRLFGVLDGCDHVPSQPQESGPSGQDCDGREANLNLVSGTESSVDGDLDRSLDDTGDSPAQGPYSMNDPDDLFEAIMNRIENDQGTPDAPDSNRGLHDQGDDDWIPLGIRPSRDNLARHEGSLAEAMDPYDRVPADLLNDSAFVASIAFRWPGPGSKVETGNQDRYFRDSLPGHSASLRHEENMLPCSAPNPDPVPETPMVVVYVPDPPESPRDASRVEDLWSSASWPAGPTWDGSGSVTSSRFFEGLEDARADRTWFPGGGIDPNFAPLPHSLSEMMDNHPINLDHDAVPDVDPGAVAESDPLQGTIVCVDAAEIVNAIFLPDGAIDVLETTFASHLDLDATVIDDSTSEFAVLSTHAMDTTPAHVEESKDTIRLTALSEPDTIVPLDESVSGQDERDLLEAVDMEPLRVSPVTSLFDNLDPHTSGGWYGAGVDDPHTTGVDLTHLPLPNAAALAGFPAVVRVDGLTDSWYAPVFSRTTSSSHRTTHTSDGIGFDPALSLSIVDLLFNHGDFEEDAGISPGVITLVFDEVVLEDVEIVAVTNTLDVRPAAESNEVHQSQDQETSVSRIEERYSNKRPSVVFASGFLESVPWDRRHQP